MGYKGADNAAAAQVGLKEYDKLVDEVTKKQRLECSLWKYAAAQAWLTDSSLFLPAMSSSGAAPIISRVVPFSASSSQSEIKDQTYTSKVYSSYKIRL